VNFPKQNRVKFDAGLKRRNSEGFTLIELLVVIAIIAMLAALLLPALSRAKASVRRADCLSRQKQWALAFHLYTDDNDGWLPREGYHDNGEVYWNNWAHVQDRPSRDVWYNALNPFVSVPPASSYAWPRETQQRFYERSSFFHCPSARFSQGTGGWIALFSIAMNSQLVDPPNVPTVKLGQITDVTQTVLLLDNLLDGEKPVVEQQARDNLGQPAAYANRFAGRRHGRGGNIAFADGHVESVPGEEVVATSGVNAGWAILPPVRIFWETE
jgi:prepilin-type N-terminal cleavage/methylation domain-containing protein/prepilin-type processing-associated H-X9-DG protein